MTQNKDYQKQYLKVANHYLQIENYFSAIETLEEAYEKTKDPEFLFKIGLIYKEKVKNLEKGLEFFNKTLKFNSLNGTLHNEIARIQISQNQIDKAKITILDGLKINSFHEDLIYSLSTITKPDNYFNENLLKNVLDKSPKSVKLNYALAKYYDDLKDYEKACKCYDFANQLQHAQNQFNHKNFEISANYLLNNFKKKNRFTALTSNHNLKFIPIFIVGMPRSGTTLVEQIISSHSKVASGGELLFLPKIYNSFLKEHYQEKENKIDSKDLHKYASDYINFSSKQINASNQTYFTDKLPNNFLLIGFIKLLFPKSPIILCEREKKDIYVSIYKNLFTEKDLCYSNNQKDIIKYYLNYINIISTWKKEYEIFSVSYENLINNFQSEVKRIINYCNLELEESNIHFQKSNNPVFTLSSYQVRQPIYKSSVNSFRNYEKYWLNFLS